MPQSLLAIWVWAAFLHTYVIAFFPILVNWQIVRIVGKNGEWGNCRPWHFFPILNLHIKKCGEDEEIFATIKNWQRLKGGIFICLEAMGMWLERTM